MAEKKTRRNMPMRIIKILYYKAKVFFLGQKKATLQDLARSQGHECCFRDSWGWVFFDPDYKIKLEVRDG